VSDRTLDSDGRRRSRNGLLVRIVLAIAERLIKKVRVSVVALVSPSQGGRATLSASGLSRVVVGGDSFRQTAIQRVPETVALTSPMNASGAFELDAQPELLLPFESMRLGSSRSRGRRTPSTTPRSPTSSS
jgi:hypothetical protein